MTTDIPHNPLLAPWPGRYGGIPPFASVQTGHFLPAITESIASFHSDLAAIASSSEQPSFANTMEACVVPFPQCRFVTPCLRALPSLQFCNTLRRYCAAGKTLQLASAIYSTWSSVNSTPEFQAIETKIEPLLAAAQDAVFQNAALFARIKVPFRCQHTSTKPLAISFEAQHYPKPLTISLEPQALHDDATVRATLSPEQARLLEVTFKNFKRRGALLGDAEKPEVAAINQVQPNRAPALSYCNTYVSLPLGTQRLVHTILPEFAKE
jgi:peptidyl-dipeptidase Dcp